MTPANAMATSQANMPSRRNPSDPRHLTPQPRSKRRRRKKKEREKRNRKQRPSFHGRKPTPLTSLPSPPNVVCRGRRTSVHLCGATTASLSEYPKLSQWMLVLITHGAVTLPRVYKEKEKKKKNNSSKRSTCALALPGFVKHQKTPGWPRQEKPG